MRRFFLRLALFLVLLAAMGIGLDRLLATAYLAMRAGRDSKTTYVLKEARQDALIFGTSRAIHHYDPEILAKATGLSTFNAGRDGMSLFYSEGMIEAVLARYRPKLIVLDLYEEDLEARASDGGRLAVFAPYLDRFPGLRDAAWHAGAAAYAGFRMPVFRYNAKLIPIALNLVSRREAGGNGFIPLRERLLVSSPPQAAPDPAPDAAKLASLDHILAVCRSAGVPLVGIRSPVFEKPGDHPSLGLIADHFAHYGMRYLDFAGDPAFLRAEYFKDATHLNADGAALFSAAVGQALGGNVAAVAKREEP